MPASLFYYPATGLECVRAIFNFTSYAVLMFFSSAMPLPHSECPLPPCLPFLTPAFISLSRHLPHSFSHIVIYLSHPSFFSFSSSLSVLSLKCLCFLSIWFPPLCFHLSLSGGVAVLPHMLIMFLCSERKLLNHSHQDPTHAHMHKQTRSSHTVFFCLWKCAPPPLLTACHSVELCLFFHFLKASFSIGKLPKCDFLVLQLQRCTFCSPLKHINFSPRPLNTVLFRQSFCNIACSQCNFRLFFLCMCTENQLVEMWPLLVASLLFQHYTCISIMRGDTFQFNLQLQLHLPYLTPSICQVATILLCLRRRLL